MNRKLFTCNRNVFLYSLMFGNLKKRRLAWLLLINCRGVDEVIKCRQNIDLMSILYCNILYISSEHQMIRGNENLMLLLLLHSRSKSYYKGIQFFKCMIHPVSAVFDSLYPIVVWLTYIKLEKQIGPVS